jgi:hypothetical protein
MADPKQDQRAGIDQGQDDGEIFPAGLPGCDGDRQHARLAPLGNPFVEVTVERGAKSVTRDVAVNGALWLPVELSAQREARRNEAT